MFVKPNLEYVLNRESSKDGRRNAIAMVEHTTFEEAQDQVQKVLETAEIPFLVERFAPLGDPITTTFRFFKEPVIPTGGYKEYHPGIFIERVVVGRDEKFRNIDSEDTFMIWISFVLKRKVLTEWRRKLIPLFIQ